MSAPFDPASLDLEAFLAGPRRAAGPDGEGSPILVDARLGKDFAALQAEILADDPEALTPDPDAPASPAIAHPGYRFVGVPAGVVLLDGTDTAVGGYLGCDLAIAPAHRGRGLGAELVLEYAMRWGGLPVWDHDVPGYTPAGERAHRAAHRLADSGVYARKRTGLTAEADRP